MEKWINKVAVVTGASAGIGAAVTKSLAAHGMIVVGLARRVERVEEIAKEFDGKVFAFKCDVSDLKSIKEAFKWIDEKFPGGISVMINNAGKGNTVKITDTSDEVTEALNDVIATNFTGLVHCSREAIRLIKKSGDFGMVINMSSVQDSIIPFGIPRNVYPPTKHAIRAFSEVLRQELITTGEEKIRVANLSPGAVKTEFRPPSSHAFFTNFPELSAEDVAESVVYLLSTPTNVNVTQLTIKPVGEKV